MADNMELAKKRLSETLRDRMQKYWDLMKDWYRRRISKDDFDSKAKFLLGENNIRLHNEFLFAILVKCQTGSAPSHAAVASPVPKSPEYVRSPEYIEPTPMMTDETEPQGPPPPSTPPPFTTTAIKPPKPKTFKVPEIPYRALDPTRYYEPPQVQLFPRDLDTILLCTHELMLPDLSTLHVRMLLVAWELELDEVTEETAHLLMLALRCYLKNVIQALISNETSWNVKKGTSFHHSFGQGASSRPFLFPTSSSTSAPPVLSDKMRLEGVREAEAIRLASLSGPVRELKPLNLFHLRDALQVNRHCVPVHSVYSLNMERIIAGMWHPSQEEEEQRKTVEQWRKSMEQNTPFSIRTAANYGRR